MKSYLKTILTALVCFLSMAVLCNADDELPPLKESKLSAEVLGVLRLNDLDSNQDSYGVGAGVAYNFNAWVKGHIRAIAYESPDNWRGGAIDEGSALVEARLFHSQNGRISLSAIGGADRDFRESDWGFSVGARAALVVYGPFSIGAESRIRAWFEQDKDLISSVFGQVSF